VPQPWAAEPGSARPGSVGKTVDAVGVVALYPAAHGARVAAQRSAMVAADQPCWDSRIMTRRRAMR
jgi:hypothetical protein